MSEIKDRQDAASDIDPIVAAQADDNHAAAAVEGLAEATDPVEAEVLPDVEAAELSSDAAERADEPTAAAEPGKFVYSVSEAPAADFGADNPAALHASDDIADAIEAALLSEAQEPSAEPYAEGSFEHMPAAYADTVAERDVLADSVEDEAPLLDTELEDGIASVFATLRAARDDSGPVEASGDLEAADGVTFRLLGELDRLWHRAA